MSIATQFLKSKFVHMSPGQVMKIGDYVAKPKNSTWFFISDLEKIRDVLRSQGMTFTPRFRGPRVTTVNIGPDGRAYRRSNHTRSSNCLKQDAEFFSIAYLQSR